MIGVMAKYILYRGSLIGRIFFLFFLSSSLYAMDVKVKYDETEEVSFEAILSGLESRERAWKRVLFASRLRDYDGAPTEVLRQHIIASYEQVLESEKVIYDILLNEKLRKTIVEMRLERAQIPGEDYFSMSAMRVRDALRFGTFKELLKNYKPEYKQIIRKLLGEFNTEDFRRRAREQLEEFYKSNLAFGHLIDSINGFDAKEILKEVARLSQSKNDTSEGASFLVSSILGVTVEELKKSSVQTYASPTIKKSPLVSKKSQVFVNPKDRIRGGVVFTEEEARYFGCIWQKHEAGYGRDSSSAIFVPITRKELESLRDYIKKIVVNNHDVEAFVYEELSEFSIEQLATLIKQTSTLDVPVLLDLFLKEFVSKIQKLDRAHFSDTWLLLATFDFSQTVQERLSALFFTPALQSEFLSLLYTDSKLPYGEKFPIEISYIEMSYKDWRYLVGPHPVQKNGRLLKLKSAAMEYFFVLGERSVHLHSAGTGNIIWNKSYDDPLVDVAFCQAPYLAVCTGQEVELVDSLKKTVVKRLKKKDLSCTGSSFESMAVKGDDGIIVLECGNETVLWNVEDDTTTISLDEASCSIGQKSELSIDDAKTNQATSPDGLYNALLHENGLVELRDANSCGLIALLKGEPGARDLQFSSDGTYLIVLYDDCVRVWHYFDERLEYIRKPQAMAGAFLLAHCAELLRDSQQLTENLIKMILEGSEKGMRSLLSLVLCDDEITTLMPENQERAVQDDQRVLVIRLLEKGKNTTAVNPRMDQGNASPEAGESSAAKRVVGEEVNGHLRGLQAENEYRDLASVKKLAENTEGSDSTSLEKPEQPTTAGESVASVLPALVTENEGKSLGVESAESLYGNALEYLNAKRHKEALAYLEKIEAMAVEDLRPSDVKPVALALVELGKYYYFGYGGFVKNMQKMREYLTRACKFDGKVFSKEVEKVARLLNDPKKIAEIQKVDAAGFTPLMYAAKKGKKELVRILLELGADVNMRGGDKGTALYWAVLGSQTEIIKLFTLNGANLQAFGIRERTACHDAIIYDKFDSLVTLIECGADANAIDSDGIPLLHYAVRYNGKMLEYLLDHGANVNGKDCEGETALFKDMDKTIAEILFDGGANVNVRSNNGSTPLHSACSGLMPGYNRKREMVLWLIDKGADVNVVNEEGKSPLSCVAVQPVYSGEDRDVKTRSLCEIAEYLLAKGAATEVSDKEKKTPLLFACINQIKPLVELLLKYGANVNALDQTGRCALHGFDNDSAMLSLLISKGVNTSTINLPHPWYKCTLLQYALSCDKEEVVELLLKNGANPDMIEQYVYKTRSEKMKALFEKYSNKEEKVPLSTEKDTTSFQDSSMTIQKQQQQLIANESGAGVQENAKLEEQFLLAKRLHDEQKYKECFDCLTKLVELELPAQLHGAAWLLLGELYYGGLGVDQNKKEAQRCFEKVVHE